MCYNAYMNFTVDTADINPYDVYGYCWGPNETTSNTGPLHQYTPWLKNPVHGKLQDVSIPCVWSAPLEEYFRRADVIAALHISDNAPMWTLCVDMNYTRDESRASMWAYEELQNKFRILFYSGDTDGVIPTLGSMRWVESLGWDTVEDWRAYFVDGQVGGYIQVYDGLTFATVNGAGHMVPQLKRP